MPHFPYAPPPNLTSAPQLMTYLINDAKLASDHGELSMRWLRGDAASVIIAGSETVALTLTFLFYELAKHPEQVAKLRAELDPMSNPLDAKALAHLPHLNAVINEIMRLHPAVPTSGLRMTPPEGMMIGETYVPGDITVSTPAYIIGRLDSCYEQPGEFIPERWYPDSKLVKNKIGFAPFSAGMCFCSPQHPFTISSPHFYCQMSPNSFQG